MKMTFLRIGVITISLLSASVFSFKIFEIHFHIGSRSEARPANSNSLADRTLVTEMSDDSPARISFRRGNSGEKISGLVSHSRNYVLRAKNGQSLSGTISSPNGCVVFNTGSLTIDFSTIRGDNSLTVINNCGRQSNFDLAVDIR
jgi:hypothetical protein